MQLLNIFTLAMLTATSTVEPESFVKDSNGNSMDVIYQEWEDNQSDNEVLNSSTSTRDGYIYGDDTIWFTDAEEIEPNEYVTELFPMSDDFDYYKYTATYSRCAYIQPITTNVVINVNVYFESIGFDIPYYQYASDETFQIGKLAFVPQGETVYFQIWCDVPATYTIRLRTDLNPSGYGVIDVGKLHGYNVPHAGPATIYYYFHNSVDEYVDGEDYTFRDCFLEAMAVWEACGNITFQQSLLKATCKIKLNDELDMPSLIFSQNTLTGNTYPSKCELPSDIRVFNQLFIDVTKYDGSPVTKREAVVGMCVTLMGAYLGLAVVSANNYSYNMMHLALRAFYRLGDGDIASFIELWGDANLNQ